MEKEEQLPTLEQKRDRWESLIREVLLQVPGTTVWKCETPKGVEIVTLDVLEKGEKYLHVGKLSLPATFPLIYNLVHTLITHADFTCMFVSSKKLLHPTLTKFEENRGQFYYVL